MSFYHDINSNLLREYKIQTGLRFNFYQKASYEFKDSFHWIYVMSLFLILNEIANRIF